MAAKILKNDHTSPNKKFLSTFSPNKSKLLDNNNINNNQGKIFRQYFSQMATKNTKWPPYNEIAITTCKSYNTCFYFVCYCGTKINM